MRKLFVGLILVVMLSQFLQNAEGFKEEKEGFDAAYVKATSVYGKASDAYKEASDNGLIDKAKSAASGLFNSVATQEVANTKGPQK